MNKVSNPPRERPLLIYDGGCGFCRLMVSRWREWMAGVVDDEPSQAVAQRFPEIPPENFEKSLHLITPDGRVATGAGAVFEIMSFCDRHDWLWRLYQKFPKFAAFTDAAYAFTARHRSTVSRIARIFYGSDFAHPSFNTGCNLFLRLLGLTYVFAFMSLWSQVIGLAGEHGIVPAARLMDAVREQHVGFWQLPTLCHFTGAGDAALIGLCAAGVVCGVLMTLGILPVLSALGSWLIYLSLCSVIEVFLNFQWDALLLEAGFIAIFLPPMVVRLRWRGANFSSLARWMVIWLLFRLMFASGVVKLASRDESWWNLSALTYHYWTTCIPTWTCWYMDKLPMWAQKASCLAMFVIELAVPFFVFFPRRLRHFAAASFLLLMLIIELTGNYGFFDILTAVFCLVLIDDHAWRKLVARIRRRPPAPVVHERRLVPLPTKLLRIAGIPALLAALAISMLPFSHLVAQTQAICGAKNPWQPSSPGWLAGLHRNTAQFRSVNGYGLFAAMTKQRDEIIIEGSDDGVTWKAYEFKWKPGDVKRRPQFCTPHMPRLDWQMWFAALGDIRGQPWLVNTIVRLLENEKTVTALLETNPFPDKPPRAIRCVAYPYRFTTRDERATTGGWWKRGEPREYCPPVMLENGRPVIARPAR